MDEFLSTAPESDLLETDIADGSYNKAPWRPKDAEEEHLSEAEHSNDDHETDPLSFLTGLSDSTSLDAAASVGRTNCHVCSQSRRYFCYTCHIPLEATASSIPKLDALPIKVDIIKHPGEVDGKVRCVKYFS